MKKDRRNFSGSVIMSIEKATRFFSDAGPFLTYYIVYSFTSKCIGCFAASGVGLVGFILDFITSRLNPSLPWPRLLNSAELVLYFTMAITFLYDKQCSMWANFLQLAGITITMGCGLAFSSTSFMDELFSEAEHSAGLKSTQVETFSFLFARSHADISRMLTGFSVCSCRNICSHDGPGAGCSAL